MNCCDTSFLISLYSDDAHSPLVIEYLSQSSISLTLTPFNYFEFCSALHLSAFRKKLHKNEAVLFIANFENDLITKFFLETSCNLGMILTEARNFSSHYATNEGHRAFDIIHVASALHLQAEAFLTFDKKQKLLAKSLGLKTPL